MLLQYTLKNITVDKKNQLILTKKYLQESKYFFKNHLNYLFIDINKIILPIKTHKFTVLKSPHINKKARDQFQVKKYNLMLINKIHNNFNNRINYYLLTIINNKLSKIFKNIFNNLFLNLQLNFIVKKSVKSTKNFTIIYKI